MRIHQLLASLEFGDAVAGFALAIQRELRRQGHESEIFAGTRHPLATEPSRPLGELAGEAGALLIYHHAFRSEAIDRALDAFPGRCGMIYHNVTPAHWFRPWSDELAASAQRARAALGPLRARMQAVFTESEFNRRELEAAGYGAVGLLPLALDLDRLLALAPDGEVMARHGGAETTFLFVGRLAPNKRQEDVIRVFAWYRRFIDPACRLVLVGAAPEIDAYRADLVEVARTSRVEDAVVFAGKVSPAELVAYYRVADVFLCMSEHEGFGVPLVEAMAFDVPVVARAAAAVAETLGDAGLLVGSRAIPEIAEAVALVLHDPVVRAHTLERQRRRLEAFAPAHFEAGLRQLIASLVAR